MEKFCEKQACYYELAALHNTHFFYQLTPRCWGGLDYRVEPTYGMLLVYIYIYIFSFAITIYCKLLIGCVCFK